MKFINNGHGALINVDRVRHFRIDPDNCVWAVFDCLQNEDGLLVDYDEVSLCKCDDRDDAEKFLRELYSEIMR